MTTRTPLIARRAWLHTVCVAILLSCMCAVTAPLALANDDDAARRAAIAEAMSKAGGSGKVLGVNSTVDGSGQTHYEIRILSNGRVRTFNIAAKQ